MLFGKKPKDYKMNYFVKQVQSEFIYFAERRKRLM